MANGRTMQQEPIERDRRAAVGFARSSSANLARGGLLLLAALVVGVVLLQKSDRPSVSEAVNVSGTDAASTASIPTDTLPAGQLPVATPTTVQPELRATRLVKVLVVNGSGVNRAAARVKKFLEPNGYDLQKASDAVADNYADAVYFQPGYEQDARQIAATLGVAQIVPTPLEKTVKDPVPDFHVQVMVGPTMAQTYKNVVLADTAAVAVASSSGSGSSGTSSGSSSKKATTRRTTTKKATAASATKKKSSTKSTAAATADAGAASEGTSSGGGASSEAPAGDSGGVARTPVVQQDAVVE